MADNVDLTVVLDAEGLRGAVEQGARHIELRSHIDLATLDPIISGDDQSGEKLLGYLREEVQSIRVRTCPALRVLTMQTYHINNSPAIL